MKAFTDLLQKHPEILSKYVSLGFALVDKTVTPINKFMQHLMVVQGIDPNTEPGEQERKAFEDVMNSIDDEEEFDSDFDFAPALKAFDKTNKKLQHLHLTKEKFKDLTDVSQLGLAPNPLQRTKSDRLKDAAAKIRAEGEQQDSPSKIFNSEGLLNTSSLKEALTTLKKYAEELESGEDKSANASSKLVKAHELAQRMVERGLLDSSIKAFQTQVDEIMKFSDDALFSLERVILRHPKTENKAKVTASRENVAVGKNKKSRAKAKVTKTFKGCFRRVSDKE